LLEKPNGNPRSNNARLASAHVRPGVDAWKIVTKLMNQPLEDLRFFPTRQAGNIFSKSLKLDMTFLSSLSPMQNDLATWLAPTTC